MSQVILGKGLIQDPRWAEWTEVERLGSLRTPVLLLGGLAVSAFNWRRVSEALAAEDRSVIAASLHGFTGYATDMTECSAARWIGEAEARLIRLFELHGAPVILGGFSAGSLIAPILAARHPSKVRALSLVGFCPRLRSAWKQAFVTSMALLDRHAPHSRHRLACRSIASASRRASPFETDEYRAQPRMPRVPLTAIAALGQLQLGLPQAIGQTDHPVYLYHGRYDDRTSLSTVEQWVRRLTMLGHPTFLRTFDRSPHSVLLCGDADRCAASIVADIRAIGGTT